MQLVCWEKDGRLQGQLPIHNANHPNGFVTLPLSFFAHGAGILWVLIRCSLLEGILPGCECM